MERERWLRIREIYREALAIFRGEYGASHTLTSNAHYTLGLIYTDGGDPAAAREQLQRALDIRVQAFGESHREVWNAMHRLAKLDLYEWLGGLREASLAAL